MNVANPKFRIVVAIIMILAALISFWFGVRLMIQGDIVPGLITNLVGLAFGFFFVRDLIQFTRKSKTDAGV
jgi:hypothetical protein